MKDLVIVGAGGLGRETLLMVRQFSPNEWRPIGFYDDAVPQGSLIDGLPVKGRVRDLQRVESPLSVVISIADGKIRSNVVSILTNKNLNFPTLAHPEAHLGSEQFNKIGKGCIITRGVVLTTGIQIHDFVIINLMSSIGHDVEIESFVSIMPLSSISGNVKIGARCFVGTHATILQGLNIGGDAVIGAGAVITKNVPPDSVMIGIPGRAQQI